MEGRKHRFDWENEGAAWKGRSEECLLSELAQRTSYRAPRHSVERGIRRYMCGQGDSGRRCSLCPLKMAGQKSDYGSRDT